MRGGYRAKIFFATLGVAAVVVLLASTTIAFSLRRQTRDRIERGLISEARLAAELLSQRSGVFSAGDLQAESKAIGRNVEARVTLVAADGRVVGDSSQDAQTLAQLENHRDRPEILDASQRGIGTSTRFSATLGVDMLYVAVRVTHPSIATVRLALPLTEVNRQMETIWRAAMYALAVSIVGASVMAWVASTVLVRRLSRLAVGAQRYAGGEAAAPPVDHEDDEIGMVARVLEQAVRQLGERATDLARDRARLETILTGMVEGVVVVDKDQRVQLLNAAARRMLRVEGDVAGRHVLECVRHPAVVSQLTHALAQPPSTEAEPGVIQDSARVFLARAAPITGPGGAVLVLHDITDLTRADQIRRDFVANVSHELRTPLTAIRGYVEALTDDAEAPVGVEERRRFLDIIARHTARMERLTKDLLRLARLEAGQERLEYSRCRVGDLFDSVVADLKPGIEQKGQRVVTHVEPGAEIISADTQQLQDAIRNLVENAVIYSPEGKTITLGARRDHGHVVLTVADEGPGIPQGDLGRVFERFYRVDKARSRESGGTGLGLAIVKHIVDRMGGSVRADNRQEGGAVFTLELPFGASVPTDGPTRRDLENL